jgi:hypothetical protein
MASRYRHHLLLAGGTRGAAEEVVRQLDVLVLRDKLGGGLHVAFSELVTAANQPGQLIEHLFGAADVGRLPFENELVAVRANPDGELPFELFEVFVVGAVERFGPFIRDRNLAHDGGRRDGVTPCKIADSSRDSSITPRFLLQFQLSQLFVADGRGSPGHEIDRLSCLREGDDVPD